MIDKISAIVLAAGTSSRMGKKNKLCLPFQETTILNTIITQIVASDVDEVIVVLGHEKELVKTCLTLHDKIRLVDNLDYLTGMTSTIQTGIKTALKTSKGYLVCLSDMPYILTEDYNRIIHSFKAEKSILVPFFQGKKGNPILFSTEFKDDILAHSQPEGCRDILKNNLKFIQKIEMDSDSIFRDIDTVNDL